MSTPPWIWVLFAWLIARDTKLHRWVPWARIQREFQHTFTNGLRPFLSRLLPCGSCIAQLVVAVSLLIWFLSTGPDSTPVSTRIHPEQSPNLLTTYHDPLPTKSKLESPDLERIYNSTLGFQKIFVVNLPERTDKRDALALVAALTNIKLEWTKAIRGSDVPDKALPIGPDRRTWRDGGIGSWRSQMNVIRRMVEHDVQSALILEDDADWDVRLKDQLKFIAMGTRVLLDRAKEHDGSSIPQDRRNSAPAISGIPWSPYGDDWDILWLGHCGETFPERIPGHQVVDPTAPRYTYYAMQDDDTLPPENYTESWIQGEIKRHPRTRWVHFSGGPTCSAGYALSQSGARKVLHALSVGGTLVAQLDNAMSDLCRDHTPWDAPGDVQGPPGYPGARMRCLSVTPAVISQHKPRGRRAAESDIETVEDGEELREVGESPNLVWSARLNVQNLIHGLPMQDQFQREDEVAKSDQV